ncbi:MAG TPA: hypothetical protein V6D30_03840, partial [Leptolyngbyaceae cyanobacterium]
TSNNFPQITIESRGTPSQLELFFRQAARVTDGLSSECSIFCYFRAKTSPASVISLQWQHRATSLLNLTLAPLGTYHEWNKRSLTFP